MKNNAPAKTDLLQGVIKTLTYVNPENGYFVAKVTVAGKGEKTVVGTAPVINIGEHISAQGSWHSSNWGPQFKAVDITLSQPTMLEGIEKYLANAIEGIGKGYAKKMVNAFGESVFDIIENTPEKLGDVKGIGPKRAASIVAAYAEQKAIRSIMVFLHKAGLSASRAKRVYDRYGDDAVEKIKQNPYLLCRDIWGIGFKIADEVAAKQGIAPTSEYRVRAGIQHTLIEASGQGSCGLPLVQVREKAAELLNVDYDLIDRCIQFEIESQDVIRDISDGEVCLFLPKVYKEERYIAKRLLDMVSRTPVKPITNVDDAIRDAEVEIGLMLEETQREAVRTALASQVCVITGGPGVGKTTITRTLLQVFDDAGLKGLVLCAPTGKAAKRAAEATGMEAKTIHRTLVMEKNGQFKHHEKNPLQGVDVFVIDESSMVDVALMSAVCGALSVTTRFIIIGDVDQLPSVGPGKVLADIIDSGVIPCVRLKTIFRQAATSHIITNAHAINRGEMPDVGWNAGSDFCFTNISPKDPKNEADKIKARQTIEAELLRLARDMYKLGWDPVRDVQILAPMRKGLLGVESLNIKLQSILNPLPEAELELWGTKWRTGDKVMQMRNNYDKNVFNGDIGFIHKIDKEARIVIVDFDGNLIEYKANEMDELTLAYAFTIHKSQGSEFPVVILPLDTSHYTMLRRNLFYTGVTRAKKLCVVVGQPFAAKLAVQKAQNDDRYTRLKEWLREGLPKEMREAA